MLMFRPWINHVINLLYPRVCAACGSSLLKDEETVCLKCRYALPKTGYELQPDNPVAQLFYGRVPFHAATACFFFSKSGKVQHLIHELKYKGNKEAGIFLGRQMGECIQDAPLFQDIDYLVPVPLHPKREQQRGYNQSLMIAQGIHEVTGIPIGEHFLVRAIYTATQTKKTAEERFQNVKDIFEVRRAETLQGKHLLIIDDVLTTGATLEACAHCLETIPDITLSTATAACAGG